MIINRVFTSAAMLTALCSCSHSIQHYQDHTPALQPETFFKGQLKASGVIKNFSGQVTRWFNVDIVAYWEDGVGTLEEDFVFNDGEKQRRVWTLTPVNSQHKKTESIRYFTGTAADVVGSAEIEVSGNAMFLDYVLRVPYKESTLDIKIDDKMYFTSDNFIINESVMYKFGIPVGSISLTIYKP